MTRPLVAVILAVSALYAQSAPAASADRVLYFANTDTAQGMREITNAVRAITEIPAMLDLAKRTLQLTGNAKQMELAEWVFGELDRPANTQPPSPQAPSSTTYSDQLPNGKTVTEAVLVLHFPNAESPRNIQETANTIRAITEIVRLMPVNGTSAIVLRGNADRTALAEWIFNQLAQSAAAQRPGVYEYRLPPTSVVYDHADLTRVFYLSKTNNLQPIISAVREATKITRMMPQNQMNAIVARGTDSQMATASQLVLQLDRSPAQP
ncbi:MAG: hypothetical protein JO336_00085 [Acidobacteriia bacterium]|nr:hypothetical protein [Terriglobia bacterium]